MGKRSLSGYVNGNDFLDKFNEKDRATINLLHIKHAKLDEKFAIALHEIKNQRIRHNQHVANTIKLEPIQCFQRKPWFINPVHESLFLQAPRFPTIPTPQQPQRSML